MAEKQVAPEERRVTNTQRQATVERLGVAMTAGCLTLSEFEERVGAAWAAAVRSDLDVLVRDLPPDLPLPRHRSNRDLAERALPMVRGASATWLVFTVIAMVLWGLACLVDGAHLVFPWFLVIFGAGGALLAPLWHVTDRWRR